MTVQSEESLRDLLHSDFLNCRRCEQRCSDPQLLPSLDIVCSSCADPSKDVTVPSLLHKSLSHLASASGPQRPPCDYCQFAGGSERAEARCVECGDHLCSSCCDAHLRTRITRDHRLVKLHEVSDEVRRGQRCCCAYHPGERADLFCVDCSRVACSRCTGDDDHAGHRMWRMHEVEEREKEALRLLMRRVESRGPNIADMGRYLGQYTAELHESQARIRGEIRARCAALRRCLDDTEASLLSSLESALDKELSPLKEKTLAMQTAQNDFQSAVNFTRRLVNHGRPEEILPIKSLVDARLEELLKRPVEGVADELKIGFRQGPAVEESVPAIVGRLTLDTRHGTHKEVSCVSLPSLPSQVARHEDGLTSEGNRCLYDPPPPQMDTATSGTTFPPPRFLDRPKLVLEFEARSPSDSRDIWPTGLSINPLTGDIFVLDRDNKKVKVFDVGRGGNPFLKMEIGGTAGDGSLTNPYDLCLTAQGHMLLTDYHQEAVKMFDSSSGQFIASVAEPGLFKHPRGIAVDPSGEFFAVADCRRRRVTVHSVRERGKVTGCVEAEDVFSDPYYVCISADYRLVVTDWAAPNLNIFDFQGRLLSRTGTYQEVLQPYGVCCDAQSTILVADNTNHRIQVATSDGRFLRHLVSKQDGLWHPMALDINTSGHLVVTEALGKVKVFKYL